MIVPMKKISVVCLEKEKVGVLESLGQIGTVHIEQQNPQSLQLQVVTQKLQRVEEALSLLPKEKGYIVAFDGHPDGLVEDILKLQSCRVEVEERQKYLSNLLKAWKPWGDVNPQDLNFLESRGFFPRLYTCNPADEKKITDIENTIILSRDKNLIRALVIQRNQEPLIGLEYFPWPELGVAETNQELNILKKDLEAFESRIQHLARHRQSLINYIENLQIQNKWESALASFDREDKVAYFSGFTPSKKLEDLKALSSSMGFGIAFSDPKLEDDAPTLVETPRWLEIIKPVFGFLGTIPGYKELDISFFFLIFFTIFFAMIIGDAGYGLLFLLGSLGFNISRVVKKQPVTQIGVLMMLMGLSTVVWGTITGSWFGSQAVLNFIPGLKLLVVPGLDAFSVESSKTVQLFCFILGLIHLSIAQLWNILRELAGSNKLKSLAQIGWFGINFGLFNLILNLVLDKTAYPVLDISMYLIYIGLGLVVVFGSQEGDFFKGILAGFANLLPSALGLVSGFGDIISYIRLFAVGLAGLEIAKSFNAMAAPLMDAPSTIAGGILILLLGHLLNLVLASLGVLVHGIRLNMLEFSGRLGLEWSGKEFTPFVIKSEQIKSKE